MKLFIPLALSILLTLFSPSAGAQEPRVLENPENLTGQMIFRVDTVTLIYQIDLFVDRPIEDIYGALRVLDSRDTLSSLANYVILNMGPRKDNQKQFVFRRFYRDDLGGIKYDGKPGYYDYWARFCRLNVHVVRPNHRFKMGEFISISSFDFVFDTQPRPAGSAPSEWAKKAADEYVALGVRRDVKREEVVSAKEDVTTVESDGGFGWKHWLFLLIFIGSAFFMAPLRAKMKASGMMWYIVGAGIVMVMSFDDYYPFVPPFLALVFILPKVFTKRYDQYKLIKLFVMAEVVCLIVCSMVAISMLGFKGVMWSVGWLITVLVAYFAVATHLSRFYCLHCNTYGKHIKLTEELVNREIIRTQTSKLEYDHTEETTSKIIDWYNRRYGLRIDVWDKFDVYCECVACHKIYKHLKINHQSDES